MDLFLHTLDTYIGNTEGPVKWLPIVVLVYLLFELRSLKPFEKKLIIQHYHRQTKEELLELLLAGRQKKLFLILLAAFVSWAIFFILLEC